MRLDLSISTTRTYTRYLAHLARYCVVEGIPLDVEQVLDPDTVDRFIRFGTADVGMSVRAAYRTDLSRIGPVLTKSAPWPIAQVKLNNEKRLPPYTAHEVGVIMRDAGRQSTARRSIGGRAIVALSLGAGVSGMALTQIRGIDVARRAGVVVVRVPMPKGRERTVPVRGLFEDEMLALADLANCGLLVGGTGTGRNLISKLCELIVIDQDRVRLDPRRLRATWLVAQLSSPVPLMSLLTAAGLTKFGALSELLEFIEPVSWEESAKSVRDA